MTLAQVETFLRFVKESAKLSDQYRFETPLYYLFDYLHLNTIFNEEYKRALFVGFVFAIVAFFIILISAFVSSQKPPLGLEILASADLTADNVTKELEDAFNRHTQRHGAYGGSEAFFDVLMERATALEEAVGFWTHTDQTSIQFILYLFLHYEQQQQQSNNTFAFQTPLVLNILVMLYYKRRVKELAVEDKQQPPAKEVTEILRMLEFCEMRSIPGLTEIGIPHKSIMGYSLTETENKSHDDELSYVLFVDHLTQSLVLMVRSVTDIKTMSEALSDLIGTKEMATTIVGVPCSVSSESLYYRAQTIAKEIQPFLSQACQSTGYSKLTLTGYDLGGSLATLVTLRLFDEGALDTWQVQCATFGAPRVLLLEPRDCEAMNTKLTKQRINLSHFVNHQDFLPRFTKKSWENMLEGYCKIDAYSIAEKLNWLAQGYVPNLPEINHLKHASNYHLPGQCLLVTPLTSGAGVQWRLDAINPSEDLESVFMGNKVIADHHLRSYKASLGEL